MVKRDRNALKLKTPSLALARSSVHTMTLTQSLTPREDPIHPVKAAPNKPQGGQPPQGIQQIISEEEPPTDEALCNEARQKA